jgi:hypothetical protein
MIAAALTGQMATGVILGVAVQTLLAYDHAAVGVESSMSPAILLTWSCPMLQVRLLAGASQRVSV